MQPLRLRLDDQLCFALYAATNAVTRAYRPKLAEIGITYPQYLVLLVLWQEGSCTISSIATQLKLLPNGITPILDRLEQAAILVRRRDPTDRRVIHICLTTKGLALEDKAVKAQDSVVCETQLEPDTFIALRQELCALVARMEAPDATPEVCLKRRFNKTGISV